MLTSHSSSAHAAVVKRVSRPSIYKKKSQQILKYENSYQQLSARGGCEGVVEAQYCFADPEGFSEKLRCCLRFAEDQMCYVALFA